MTNGPERSGPDLDRGRRDRDALQVERRALADGERNEKRELIDRLRQTMRGSRRAREGLERERSRDDEVRRVERSEGDAARRADRAIGDAELAREQLAHASADGRALRVDEQVQAALGLVEAELLLVASLSDLVSAAPHGAVDPRISTGLFTLLGSHVRLQNLLAGALGPAREARSKLIQDDPGEGGRGA